MADEVIKDGENVSSKKRWIPVIIAGVVVLVMLIGGGITQRNQRIAEEERLAEQERIESEKQTSSESYLPGSDATLLKRQDSLNMRYGTPPEGYLWNTDGSLLSLGDKNMSAEDVVYSYFNGLSSLDFSTVQKYSRGSSVNSTFSEYFTKGSGNDYSDSFMRNMYKMALLSIQPKSVSSSIVFAENKQVFTVKASMLDLTQKEFWLDDKLEIYKNLNLFRRDQSDSTKADIYLYDYIMAYYGSEDAARRDVSFDITVQKYPDLDTGWLVSIDKDVNLACKYANGTLVTSYIKDMYGKEGEKLLKEDMEKKDE